MVMQRDRQHLVGRRHLEIERQRDLGRKRGDIGIGDVAAILAQMGSDAIGARFLRQQSGAQRVGPGRAPRVSDRGHMVDIDAKS